MDGRVEEMEDWYNTLGVLKECFSARDLLRSLELRKWFPVERSVESKRKEKKRKNRTKKSLSLALLIASLAMLYG